MHNDAFDVLALATARSVEETSLLDAVDLPTVEENTESRPRMTKRFVLSFHAEATMLYPVSFVLF